MARFTIHDLRHELGELNTRVENAGGSTYLMAEHRNGYTGLDEYDLITNKCIRTIAIGTASKCLTAALTWGIVQISDKLGLDSRQ